jgi:hypothetical protein
VHVSGLEAHRLLMGKKHLMGGIYLENAERFGVYAPKLIAPSGSIFSKAIVGQNVPHAVLERASQKKLQAEWTGASRDVA